MPGVKYQAMITIQLVKPVPWFTSRAKDQAYYEVVIYGDMIEVALARSKKCNVTLPGSSVMDNAARLSSAIISFNAAKRVVVKPRDGEITIYLSGNCDRQQIMQVVNTAIDQIERFEPEAINFNHQLDHEYLLDRGPTMDPDVYRVYRGQK